MTPRFAQTDALRALHSSDSTKLFLYGVCDADCAQAGSWTLTEVATAWGTAAADIHQNTMPQRSFALDTQGRPPIAVLDKGNLGYLWCAAACEAEAAQWSFRAVETAFEPVWRGVRWVFFPQP